MKIRKSFVAVLAALVSMPGISETATVDGLLWQYSVSEGKATIEKLLTPGVENVVVPGEVGGFKVAAIGDNAFREDGLIKSVTVSEGVLQVGQNAFYGCILLTDVNLPESIEVIKSGAFSACCLRFIRLPKSLKSVGHSFYQMHTAPWIVIEGDSAEFSAQSFGYWYAGVEFRAGVPKGIESSDLFRHDSMVSSTVSVQYPKKFAEEWKAVVPQEQFGGYVLENKCSVTVVSKMRETEPTIMDVKLTPVSTKSDVKIRPVAFLNGINSFANVVKVKTFSDGTESVVRNPVKANLESAFSWNVAADLTDKVAKLKMDVMCVEDEVVPFELVSIPSSSGHVAMTISRNEVAPMCVRDALMWLMADPLKNLRVGTLDCDASSSFKYLSLYQGEERVCKISIQDYDPIGPGGFSVISRGGYDLKLCKEMSVKRFVLEELGYTILEGNDLEYARKMTGLKLENGPYVKMK